MVGPVPTNHSTETGFWSVHRMVTSDYLYQMKTKKNCSCLEQMCMWGYWRKKKTVLCPDRLDLPWDLECREWYMPVSFLTQLTSVLNLFLRISVDRVPCTPVTSLLCVSNDRSSKGSDVHRDRCLGYRNPNWYSLSKSVRLTYWVCMTTVYHLPAPPTSVWESSISSIFVSSSFITPTPSLLPSYLSLYPL